MPRGRRYWSFSVSSHLRFSSKGILKWLTQFTGKPQDLILKLHSVFSEEELDDKILDTDGLGFNHHADVEIISDNEEGFFPKPFLQKFISLPAVIWQSPGLLKAFALWAVSHSSTDTEKFIIMYQKKTLMKKASN